MHFPSCFCSWVPLRCQPQKKKTRRIAARVAVAAAAVSANAAAVATAARQTASAAVEAAETAEKLVADEGEYLNQPR